jgi:glycosyltransferase involved in cell wall biosynthesis
VKAAAGRIAADAARPVRVLHVFRYFRPDFTGEGLYLEKLVRHFGTRGIQSDVLVSATQSSRRAGPTPPGVRRIVYFGNGRKAGQQVHPGLLLWLLCNLRHYDTVHIHAAVDRFFLVPALSRLAGRRVVQSCTLDDGFGALVASYRGWRRMVARRLVRLVNDVVTISPKLRDDTVAVMGAARTHLVTQAVEAFPEVTAEARSVTRLRFGLPDEATVLLFVGGVCRRKGVRELIDATLGLPPEPSMRLLIVGPDLETDYAAEVRRLAALADGAIQFAGYADDPGPFYGAADIFVFASHQEGFGNVLIEAMAYGLPVVCRRLPGVTDSFIAQGRTGFLFDTDSEYQAIVLRLAADPALRATVGAAARAFVREIHSFDVVADRYLSLYRT